MTKSSVKAHEVNKWLNKKSTLTPETGLPLFTTLMTALLPIGTNTTVYSGISPGVNFIVTVQDSLQVVPADGVTFTM